MRPGTAIITLAVAIVAMAVWIVRMGRVEKWYPKIASDGLEKSLAGVPRLIINRWLDVVLVGSVLFFTFASVCARLEVCGGIVCLLSEWFASVPEWLANAWDQRLKVSLALFTVLGVLYLVFAKQVSAGLAIGKDVLSYFRREPDATKVTGWSYPLRDRMHRRFDTVLRTMIASEKPTEIEIIAHSLGSVIAIQALRRTKEQDAMAHGKLGEAARKLATMGSPYDHLFEHYFPAEPEHGYAGRFAIPNKDQMPLHEWINIFRFDDFVGTLIEGPADDWPPDWPTNNCVAPDGHTNYWTDDQVLQILKAKGFL